MNQTNYDRDFYAWANEQAALLRAGRLASCVWRLAELAGKVAKELFS